MQFLNENERRVAEELLDTDESFKKVYAEHIEIDKMLNKFTTKPFITPDEEKLIKDLKLKKLHGNDTIKKIVKEKIENNN